MDFENSLKVDEEIDLNKVIQERRTEVSTSIDRTTKNETDLILEDLISRFSNGEAEAIFEIHKLIMGEQYQIDVEEISETKLHPSLINFILSCDDVQFLLPSVRVLALTSNRKSNYISDAFDQPFLEKMMAIIDENIDFLNHGLCFLINVLNSNFELYPMFRDALFFDFCNRKMIEDPSRPICFLISRMCKRTFPLIVKKIKDEDHHVIDLFIDNYSTFILKSLYEESMVKVFAGLTKACNNNVDVAKVIANNEIIDICLSFIQENENESAVDGSLSIINSLVMRHDEEILDKLIEVNDLFSNLLPFLNSPEPRIVAFVIEVFRQILICSSKYVNIILENGDIILKFIELAREGDFESRKIAVYFLCELFTSQRNTELWTFLIANHCIEILVEFLQSGDSDLSKFILTTIWHLITNFPQAAHVLQDNDIFEILEELEDDDKLQSSAIPELIREIHHILTTTRIE